MEIIFLLFFYIINILFIILPFIILYLVIKHSANQARKENMSKIDFS